MNRYVYHTGFFVILFCQIGFAITIFHFLHNPLWPIASVGLGAAESLQYIDGKKPSDDPWSLRIVNALGIVLWAVIAIGLIARIEP